MADRTFVYVVEGEPYTGTIGDYARAIEGSHYSGTDVSGTVWFVNGADVLESATATVTCGSYDEDDYATITVSVEIDKDDPTWATVRIDGRA